jgi:hypothetical protein
MTTCASGHVERLAPIALIEARRPPETDHAGG